MVVILFFTYLLICSLRHSFYVCCFVAVLSSIDANSNLDNASWIVACKKCWWGVDQAVVFVNGMAEGDSGTDSAWHSRSKTYGGAMAISRRWILCPRWGRWLIALVTSWRLTGGRCGCSRIVGNGCRLSLWYVPSFLLRIGVADLGGELAFISRYCSWLFFSAIDCILLERRAAGHGRQNYFCLIQDWMTWHNGGRTNFKIENSCDVISIGILFWKSILKLFPHLA